MTRAFEVPMYQLFYDGEEPPALPSIPKGRDKSEWGIRGKHARFLGKLQALLGKINARDRNILLAFASKASQRKSRSR